LLAMVLRWAPLGSAIVGTIVLLFGSNLLEGFFAKRQIVYETELRPAPTGVALLRLQNASQRTCDGRIEVRFETKNAKITSTRILDTNEKPVEVKHDQNRIIIELPRLAAATGFVTVELAYADMHQEIFQLTAPAKLGCTNGAYDLIDVAQTQPTRFNPSLFVLVGVSLLASTVILLGRLFLP